MICCRGLFRKVPRPTHERGSEHSLGRTFAVSHRLQTRLLAAGVQPGHQQAVAVASAIRSASNQKRKQRGWTLVIQYLLLDVFPVLLLHLEVFQPQKERSFIRIPIDVDGTHASPPSSNPLLRLTEAMNSICLLGIEPFAVILVPEPLDPLP